MYKGFKTYMKSVLKHCILLVFEFKINNSQQEFHGEMHII